jgi:glutamate racemase
MPAAKRQLAQRLLADRGIVIDDLGPCRLAGEPDAVTVKQEQLWRLHEAGERDQFYHVGAVLELRPDLDRSRLLAAYQEVAEHHDVLRTGYDAPAGPVVARPATSPPLGFDDELVLRADSREDAVRLALRAAREFGHPAFRLDATPVRTLLLDARPHAYFLGILAHDIACDRFGLRTVLVPAVARAYDRRAPEGSGTAALRLRDVAAWQRQGLRDGAIGRQVQRQRDRLRSLRRVPVGTSTPRLGSRIPLALPAAAGARAVHRGRDSGASATAVVLAAWAGAVVSVLDADTVAVGCCASGRHRPQLGGVLGNLANTLLVNLEVADRSDPLGLLDLASAQLTAALGDADAPFESVVAALTGGSPVADEWIGVRLTVHHPAEEPEPDREGVALSVHDVEFGLAKSALSLEVESRGDGFAGTLDYRPAAVPPAVAGRLVDAFRRALVRLGER